MTNTLSFSRYKIPVLIQWEKKNQPFSRWEHILYSLGIKYYDLFDHIRTCSLSLTVDQMIQLLSFRSVQKIYLDRRAQTCLHIATPTIQAPQVWQQQNQGEGVTIAILDTGIAPHSDLGSRLIAFQDFINGKEEPYDDNGHGTHCAGTAAGNGTLSQGKYCGVAPKAKLVGIKVLGKYGESNISDIIKGIYWCILNKKRYNIRVISLSLGSISEISYREDPLCLMAELAWQAGIVVVAAAGNAGPNLQTIMSPGNHPRIITVGASDDQRTIYPHDDQIASFSSRGPTLDGYNKPELFAPGTRIVSLRNPGSYLDLTMQENCVDENYFFLSGTSMATPITAGAVALILTKHPKLTPDQVKTLLLKSAFRLRQKSTAKPFLQINAWRAINAISK